MPTFFSITRFSLSRPITMLMICLAVMLIGGICFFRIPVELMPNVSFHNITVMVNIRGGMPPEIIEQQVTRPIEDALAQVSHLKTIQSTSKDGQSIVVLSFEPGTNMDFASLEVREKFAKVKTLLPREAQRPVIAKYDQHDVPVMILAVTSPSRTVEEIRKLVDLRIKDRFMRIEGVANVEASGGRQPKILVEADPMKLASANISMENVYTVLNTNNENAMIGHVKNVNSGRKYSLRTDGLYHTLTDLRDAVFPNHMKRGNVTLGDVAQVKDGYLQHSTFSRLNLKPVVSLYLQKESHTNTIQVSSHIHHAIEKLKDDLPRDISIEVLSDQALFIKEAIKQVKTTLWLGGILAIVILYVFLGSLRPTLVVGVAIPLSVIATFVFMYAKGITLNVISLSGLALGIGMLVDSAIIVLEHISKSRTTYGDLRETVTYSTQELVLSLAAATLTTIIVFLPILMVNKQIQLMYSSLAYTVMFSLLGSFIVSISVVPLLFVLCNVNSVHSSEFKSFDTSRITAQDMLRMVHGQEEKDHVIAPTEFSSTQYPVGNGLARSSNLPSLEGRGQGRVAINVWFSRLEKWYTKTLFHVLRWRYWLLIGVGILFVLSLLGFMMMEKDIHAGADRGTFTIFVELPAGAKVMLSNRVVHRIEMALREFPQIEHFTSRVEGWSSKIYVSARKDCRLSTKELQAMVRARIENLGEKERAFIYTSEGKSGFSTEVSLDIYGYDYAVLLECARKMADVIENIDGFYNFKLRYKPGRPELKLIVNQEKLASLGLTVRDIAQQLHAKVRGLAPMKYHHNGKEIETIIRLDSRYRTRLKQIKSLSISGPFGQRIPLSSVVTFKTGYAPSEIWHKDKNRMIQVSVSSDSYSKAKAIQLLSDELQGVEFPKQYHFTFSDDYYAMKSTYSKLQIAVLLMVLLIYMVLAALFESYIKPFIIMLAVPLSLIGVIVFLLITRTTISMGVFIGIVLLGGIVVNNAIVLLDCCSRLSAKGVSFIRAIVTAARLRLRPIVMTSSTTILGLLPMALNTSRGNQLWSPLAITVIGGMLAATVLVLLVIPCVLFIKYQGKGVMY